jgi:hypothetical protein
MTTIMETRHSHFGGNYVAECPKCHTVCAYWDEEDLDDNGNLICYCQDLDN